MDAFTIIMCGPPGSGKGTQVQLLAQALNERDPQRPLLSFSTGDGFRAVAQGKGYTSSLIRDVVDKGGLQPEFLAVWLWGSVFIEKMVGDEHIITDGFPRRVLEGHALDTAFSFYQRKNRHFLNITLTQEEAARRLALREQKEGRTDDRRAVLGNRFEFYRNETVPTIELFRNNPQYAFHDISGAQTVEAVHRDILQALGLS